MTLKITGAVINNNPYLLMNGFYMFTLTSGMTIDMCTSICLENKFFYSAIFG